MLGSSNQAGSQQQDTDWTVDTRTIPRISEAQSLGYDQISESLVFISSNKFEAFNSSHNDNNNNNTNSESIIRSKDIRIALPSTLIPMTTTNPKQNEKESQLSHHNKQNAILNRSCARLHPFNSRANSKLVFSTSGLTVTCANASQSNPAEAISSIGYTSGVHFWEFFCPTSCKNIKMGLISPTLNFKHFVDFNTSTPRSITFRLDFASTMLTVYLNGNLHENKSQPLPILSQKNEQNRHYWYPAVSIVERGMSVIFNPFAHDPQKPFAKMEFSMSQKYMKMIKEQDTLQQQQQAEVIQVPNEKQVQIEAEQLLLNLEKQLSHETTMVEDIEKNKCEFNWKTEIFNAERSMIIVAGNKIKQIRRNEHGHYPISGTLFENRPLKKEDEIYLDIKRSDVQLLLSSFLWEQASQGMGKKEVKALLDFFEAIEEATTEKFENPNNIRVRIEWIQAKVFVDLLVVELISEHPSKSDGSLKSDSFLNKLFNKFQKDESSSCLPGQQLVSAIQQDIILQSNTFSRNELDIQLLKILLTLDEQLFAMTLHPESSPEMTEIFSEKSSREFSCFSRLGSLMLFTKSPFNALELSEAGIFNQYDTITDLRHFSSPELRIDSIEQVKDPRTNLSDILRSQLPTNRMIMGERNFNVDLHQTVNHIPFQSHSSIASREQKLTILRDFSCDPSSDLSSYFCTLSIDGKINIWNCQIALFKVKESDFQKEFVAPTRLKGLLSTNDLKSNMKNVEDSLFFQDSTKPASSSAPSHSTTMQNQMSSEWSCLACTFLNSPNSTICQMCDQLRPTTNQQQNQQLNQNADDTDSDSRALNSNTAMLPALEVQSASLMSCRVNRLCPLIVALGMNKQFSSTNDKSISGKLRIRRFGFEPEYLSNFYKLSSSASSVKKEGSSLQSFSLTNQLDSSIISEPTIGQLEDSLLRSRNNRLIVSAVEPIFMSSQRYSRDDNEQHNPSNAFIQQSWLETAEVDYDFHGETFVACASAYLDKSCDNHSEDSSQYYWKKSDRFQLAVITQTTTSITEEADTQTIVLYRFLIDADCVNAYNKSSIRLSLIDRQILSFENEQVQVGSINTLTSKLFMFEDGILYLTTENAVLRINEKNSSQLVLRTSSNIVLAQIITRDVLAVTESNNQIHKIHTRNASQSLFLNQPQNNDIVVVKENNNSENQLFNNDVLNVKRGRDFLTTRSVGVIVGEIGNARQAENLDQSTGLFAKHGFERAGEWSFAQPIYLDHVLLSLPRYFDDPIIASEKQQQQQQQQLQLHLTPSKCFLESATPLSQSLLHSTLPTQNQQPHLPLSLVSQTGAQQAMQKQESSITCLNTESFVTNYANSSFVFRHMRDQRMQIDSIIVHSVLVMKKGAYPIGSGLVFVADSLGFFDMTSQFTGMTSEKYEQWKRHRSTSTNIPLQPWEPVAFFEFSDDREVLQVKTSIARTGKYVFLLPTNFRRFPHDYSRFFTTSMLEINYFGVTGKTFTESEEFYLDKSLLGPQPLFPAPSKLSSTLKIDLKIHSTNTWLRIPESDILAVHSVDMYSNNNNNNSSCNLSQAAINLKMLGTQANGQRVSAIRIEHEQQNQQQQQQQQHEILTMECFESEIASNSVSIPKLIEQLFSNQLKNAKGELEQGSVYFVSKLLESKPNLASQILAKFNLDSFLRAVIDEKQEQVWRQSIELIGSFYESSLSFRTSMRASLLKLFANLQQKNENTLTSVTGTPLFSERSLKRFFSLLRWLLSSECLCDDLFQQIFSLLLAATSAFKDAKTEAETLLRTNHFMSDFPLAKNIFTKRFLLSEGRANLTSQQHHNEDASLKISESSQESPLNCRIFTQEEVGSCVNKVYIVDLLEAKSIDSILLQFERMTEGVVSGRMKLAIYRCDPCECCEKLSHKSIVYSNDYQPSVITQVTQLPVEQPTSHGALQMNCIGINNLSHVLHHVQYLEIQIIFAMLPYIAPTPQSQLASKIHLLPLFFEANKNDKMVDASLGHISTTGTKTTTLVSPFEGSKLPQTKIKSIQDLFEDQALEGLKHVGLIKFSEKARTFAKYSVNPMQSNSPASSQHYSNFIYDSTQYLEPKLAQHQLNQSKKKATLTSSKATPINKGDKPDDQLVVQQSGGITASLTSQQNQLGTQTQHGAAASSAAGGGCTEKITNSNQNTNDVIEKSANKFSGFESQLQFVSNNLLSLTSSSNWKRSSSNTINDMKSSQPLQAQTQTNNNNNNTTSLNKQTSQHELSLSTQQQQSQQQQQQQQQLQSSANLTGIPNLMLLSSKSQIMSPFEQGLLGPSNFGNSDGEGDDDDADGMSLGLPRFEEESVVEGEEFKEVDEMFEEENDFDEESNVGEDSFLVISQEYSHETTMRMQLEAMQADLISRVLDFNSTKSNGLKESKKGIAASRRAIYLSKLEGEIQSLCQSIRTLQIELSNSLSLKANLLMQYQQQQVYASLEETPIDYLATLVLEICEFFNTDPSIISKISAYFEKSNVSSSNNLLQFTTTPSPFVLEVAAPFEEAVIGEGTNQNNLQQFDKLEMFLCCFEVFVVSEQGILLTQVREMLLERIIPSLSRSNCNEIVRSIVAKYLITPQLLGSSTRSLESKVISQLGFMKILDIDSLFATLQSKLDDAQTNRSDPSSSIKEILLYTWNLITILKNEYVKLLIAPQQQQQQQLQLQQQQQQLTLQLPPSSTIPFEQSNIGDASLQKSSSKLGVSSFPALTWTSSEKKLKSGKSSFYPMAAAAAGSFMSAAGHQSSDFLPSIISPYSQQAADPSTGHQQQQQQQQQQSLLHLQTHQQQQQQQPFLENSQSSIHKEGGASGEASHHGLTGFQFGGSQLSEDKSKEQNSNKNNSNNNNNCNSNNTSVFTVDHVTNVEVTFKSIAFFISHHDKFSRQDLSYVLIQQLDLLSVQIRFIPLANILRIASQFFDPVVKKDQSLFELMLFKVLSLSSNQLLFAFESLLVTLLSPAHLELNADHLAIIQPQAVQKLIEEMESHSDIQHKFLFYLQNMVFKILDYPSNTLNQQNCYTAIMMQRSASNPMTPAVWVQHTMFILSLLSTTSSLIINFQTKKLELSPKQRTPGDLQRRKSSVSSRKNSFAARKNSGLESVQSILEQQTSNTQQPQQLSSNQLHQLPFSFIEYSEKVSSEPQLMIQPSLVNKLIDVLDPSSTVYKHHKRHQIDSNDFEDGNQFDVVIEAESESEEEKFDKEPTSFNELPRSTTKSTFHVSMNLDESAQLAGTIADIICKLSGKTISEENIFLRLVTQFLASDKQMQSTLQRNLLRISKLILESGYEPKEFASTVLSLCFKIIDHGSQALQETPKTPGIPTASQQISATTSSSSSTSAIKTLLHEDKDIYELLKGWLQILLGIQSKNSSSQQQQQSNSPLPLSKDDHQNVCRLNARGACQLLKGVSKFLIRYTNFNGADGVQMANETQYASLEIAEHLLRILYFSESSPNHKAIDDALNNPHLVDSLRGSMTLLIEWYYLNRTGEDTQKCGYSPAILLFKRISELVQNLFKAIADKPLASKMSIKILLTHAIRWRQILNTSQLSTLGVYNLLMFATRSSQTFKELMSIWLISDELTAYLHQIGGFTYLFDAIDLESSKRAQLKNAEPKESVTNFLATGHTDDDFEDSLKSMDNLIEKSDALFFLNSDHTSLKQSSKSMLLKQSHHQHHSQSQHQQLSNQFNIPQLNTALHSESLSMLKLGQKQHLHFQLQQQQQQQIPPFAKSSNSSSFAFSKDKSLNLIDNPFFDQQGLNFSKMGPPPPLPPGFSQISYAGTTTNNNKSGLSSAGDAGVFGTSEINEISKSSFFKYQMQHPSYLATLSGNNNPNSLAQQQQQQQQNQLQHSQQLPNQSWGPTFQPAPLLSTLPINPFIAPQSVQFPPPPLLAPSFVQSPPQSNVLPKQNIDLATLLNNNNNNSNNNNNNSNNKPLAKVPLIQKLGATPSTLNNAIPFIPSQLPLPVLPSMSGLFQEQQQQQQPLLSHFNIQPQQQQMQPQQQQGQLMFNTFGGVPPQQQLFPKYPHWSDAPPIIPKPFVSVLPALNQPALSTKFQPFTQSNMQVLQQQQQQHPPLHSMLLQTGVMNSLQIPAAAGYVNQFEYKLPERQKMMKEDKQLSVQPAATAITAEQNMLNLQIVHDPLSLLMEEECANMVTLIPQAEQNFQTHLSQSSQDWSINKKGSKNKIAMHAMTGVNHDELSILLKLNKTIEMKKFRIGFNTASDQTTSNQIGIPYKVMIEGGLSEDCLRPFGEATLLKDERYSKFGVETFVKNYTVSVNPNDGIGKPENLKLSSQYVSYIRIRMSRPFVCLIEDLQGPSQLTYPTAISINFLSIIGHSVTSFPDHIPFHLQNIQTEAAIHILGFICARTFESNETLEKIAQNAETINRVKRGFDTLIELMRYYEEPVSSFLTAMALNNDDFADWMFNYLLDSSREQLPNTNLLTNIIISQKTSNALSVSSQNKISFSKLPQPKKSLLRIRNLLDYILKSISTLEKNAHGLSEAKIFSSMTGILPFIDAFIVTLRISYPISSLNSEFAEQKNAEICYLPVTSQEILLLIGVYERCIANSVPRFAQLILSFISALIYLPHPFTCDQNQFLLVTLFDHIWTKIRKSPAKSDTLKIMSALVLSGNEVSQWFLNDSAKKLNEIMKIIDFDMQKVKRNEGGRVDQNAKRAKHLLQLLAALTSKEEITTYLGDPYNKSLSKKSVQYSSLFSQLKYASFEEVRTSILLPIVDQETIDFFVEIVENLSHGSVEYCNDAILAIKKDIVLLETMKDDLFVNNVVRQIIQPNKTVPVCFHSFDPLCNKWIINPIKLLQNSTYIAKFASKQDKVHHPQGALESVFTTSIFSNKQKKSFLAALQSNTQNSGLFKKILKSSWNLELEYEVDGQESLVEEVETRVVSNPPFIMLLEGSMQGKKVVCGVFCSQPIDYVDGSKNYKIANISSGDDCFLFYYFDSYCLHFKTEARSFCSLETDSDTSCIAFYTREKERILHSLSPPYSTELNFNLFDMKLMDGQQEMPEIINSQFTFERAEFWVLKSSESHPQQRDNLEHLTFSMENIFENQRPQNHMFEASTFKSDSPYNLFRTQAVYHFPADMTVQEIIENIQIPERFVDQAALIDIPIKLRNSASPLLSKQEKSTLTLSQIQSNESPENGIIDFELSISDLIPALTQQQQPQKPSSFAQRKRGKGTICNRFIQKNGFKSILKSIEVRLSKSAKDPQRPDDWIMYINELSELSQIPGFMEAFMEDVSLSSTLFELLSGKIENTLSVNQEVVVETKKPMLPLFNGFKSASPPKKQGASKTIPKQGVEHQRQAVKDLFGLTKRIIGDSKLGLFSHTFNRLSLLGVLYRRIALVSKEKCRQFCEIESNGIEPTLHGENAIATHKESNDNQTAAAVNVTAEKSTNNQANNYKQKKKGVGYGTDKAGDNDKWDVSEYILVKQQVSETIAQIIDIVAYVIKGYDTTILDQDAEESMQRQFCESCILPLLESAFRSASLLEISKESTIINSYLSLLEVISMNPILFPCIAYRIDQRYVPLQQDSVLDLFTNLKKSAEIFLTCLRLESPANEHSQTSSNGNVGGNPFGQANFDFMFNNKSDSSAQMNEQSNQMNEREDKKTSEVIAKRIVQVYERIAQKLAAENNKRIISKAAGTSLTGDAVISSEIPSMNGNPSIQYMNSLKNLRFGYTDMINPVTKKYDHHYVNEIGHSSNPSQQKLIRLASEIADLANSLPVEFTNSIFMRCDTHRVDVMKCLVMGSDGTPYSNGAFLFSVFFEDTYPNTPPKFSLDTTGGGTVRFNPNLYSCGKVCLSLLGTWKGRASENWDPKISTLLQVLLSLQSIIMSDDVYFNEPGFENEAGTAQGEKQNEAYSNIVRLGNVKFAMTATLRNPPKGFEDVIRRHFLIKREAILKQCDEWIQRSLEKKASYTGLVSDHNYEWAHDMGQNPNRFHELLVSAVEELRSELNLLTISNVFSQNQHVEAEKQEIIAVAATETNEIPHFLMHPYQDEQFEKEQANGEIQSTLEQLEQQQITDELDVQSEAVKDRWSRYICAMGIDAVAKQSKCSVLLSGISALGVEIAKNIILSGVQRITLHDTVDMRVKDACGNFFAKLPAHLGMNRAKAVVSALRELNRYVPVDTSKANLQTILKDYSILIITEVLPREQMIELNDLCRQMSIKFLCCAVVGCYAYHFNDFGNDFQVVDKNGEEPKELYVESIELFAQNNVNQEQEDVKQGSKCKLRVKLLAGTKHSFEDGETVMFSSVQGMVNSLDPSQSINDHRFFVETINSNSFFAIPQHESIHAVVSSFSKYAGSGIVKNVKVPINLQFTSLKQCLSSNKNLNDFFDQNMKYHDFDKIEQNQFLQFAFFALEEFKANLSREPLPWNQADAGKMLEFANSFFEQSSLFEEVKDAPDQVSQLKVRFNKYIETFSFTLQGAFPPLCAFMGGVVAQEAIKAMTNKFVPIKQLFYTDCCEVLQDIPYENKEEFEKYINGNEKEFLENNSESKDSLVEKYLNIVLGSQVFDRIKHAKVFMIGSGAIGCELLKNFAMVYLCSGGEVNNNNNNNDEEITSKYSRSAALTLTDPDHIEMSNLNRQFLFREEHIRKSKSQTAASAILRMNPKLKNHIYAGTEKVCEATKDIFTDAFFAEQDIIANALDNVEARKYVDKRCITSRVPLLESGTLGPKGHVQVIIPFETETYGSQADPEEEGGDIPHCTLKMFPEETLHCVEWARDKFGKIVSLKPKMIMKCIEELIALNGKSPQTIAPENDKSIKVTLKYLKQNITTFDVCIEYAVKKFFKYFQKNIDQLMKTYPLTHKTKDGEDFWKLPKRAPSSIAELSADISLHADFISSFASLYARIYGISLGSSINFRTQEFKEKVIQKAIEIVSLKKIKGSIVLEEIEENKKDSTLKTQQQSQVADQISEILSRVAQIGIQNIKLSPEEFEKDDDTNGHIDLIYALTNCRALNYSLASMSWLDVKLKAGKIVPALATTTATIAGLQTIELIKVMKKIAVQKVKNAFLNLAVPSLYLSEPGKSKQININPRISTTIWDRWEVPLSESDQLESIFKYFENQKNLIVSHVLNGQQLIYSSQMQEEIKKNTRSASITQLCKPKGTSYVDLTILFTDPNSQDPSALLSDTPPVRIVFEKKLKAAIESNK